MNWFYWALGSAFFAGLTAIFAKVGVQDIDSNLATAIRTSIILFITWGMALCTSSPLAIGSISSRTWTFLILSAVATGASWLCYFRALQMGDVARVAPIDKLSVVVAIALALLFLGERFSFREYLGASLIIVGTIILAWK